MSSIMAMASVVRDNSGQLLAAVHSIELIVRNVCRKSSNVCLFTFC